MIAQTQPRRAGEWLETPYTERVVRRIGYGHGLRWQDLPDLVQEVRLALCQASPEKPISAAWLYRTASNKAVDFLRRRRRVSNEERDFADCLSVASAADPEVPLLLAARVTLLPSSLRRFFHLRYELGLSEREVARLLRICRSSTRWLERRCRRAIRRPEKLGAQTR
jgi:RNA polymerase sigma factor (sigma-70 family)